MRWADLAVVTRGESGLAVGQAPLRVFEAQFRGPSFGEEGHAQRGGKREREQRGGRGEGGGCGRHGCRAAHSLQRLIEGGHRGIEGALEDGGPRGCGGCGGALGGAEQLRGGAVVRLQPQRLSGVRQARRELARLRA